MNAISSLETIWKPFTVTAKHRDSSTEKRKPRTQFERSARTRRLVCEATLDIMVEQGGSKVSSSVVAARAKISRGALTHQFPTRNDMFTAAFRHIVDGYYKGYPFNTAPGFDRLDFDDFADALWALIYEHKWYRATVELSMLAARDNDLGREMRDVLTEWIAFRDSAAMTILGIDPSDREAIDIFQMTLSLMRGTAVLDLMTEDHTVIQRHLNKWKAMSLKALAEQSDRTSRK